jgi:NTP pyrophosphatase (non-canonical NTP hydrolase)
MQEVMQAALDAFGPVRQTDKCIGEMAELTDALLSHRHGEADREAVIDEVADVLITAGQMRLLFGADAVDARIAVKLARLSRLVADQVAAKPEPKPEKPALCWTPWQDGCLLQNGRQWLCFVRPNETMWVADCGNNNFSWHSTMQQAMRACEQFRGLPEVPLWKP